MGLSTMIPAVPAIAQANGLLRYPLVFIYWLLLPIVHWGADIPDDDEDARLSQDKLRRKGIIQPPGNRPGRVQEDRDGMGFFHRSTPVGFEGTS